MGLQTGLLGLLLVFTSGSTYYLEGDDDAPTIKWPTEYNFKAEQIDVTTGDVRTFEVWYSAANNRSRIEYYGGINKKYYVAETDDDVGYEYIIYSVTDKDMNTDTVCQQNSHDGEQKDFMPKFEDYEYSGEIKFDDKQVKVWKYVEEQEIEATLYVYRTEYNFDIPVKMMIKSYDTSKGSVENFNIVNYNSFGYIISADDVTISSDELCFPGAVALGDDLKSDLRFLDPDMPGDLDIAFHSFKRYHNKIYDDNEHKMRKAIFHKNWRYINSHNRKNLGYKLELNHFADYTDEEFSMMTGTRPSDPHAEGSMPFPHSAEELKAMEEELPEQFDMRLEGYLRPVRNQGSCGSCWAFSTTAAVEGALSRANGGRTLDLSEQSLVDCAWGYGNFGCSGGVLDKAFQYILQNQIPTERQYGSYLKLEGLCHLQNTTEKFGIRGFAKVTTDSPTAMKAALFKYGPVAVAIYAGDALKFYSSGVMYDFECEAVHHPNHGVVVVGYGVRDGTLYWIVRNSWGENWGEDGYVLLSSVNNNCMLLDSAYYPVV